MAIKEICDGCKAESPDKEGLFQGNHWVEVIVKNRKGGFLGVEREEKLLFCINCATEKGLIE